MQTTQRLTLKKEGSSRLWLISGYQKIVQATHVRAPKTGAQWRSEDKKHASTPWRKMPNQWRFLQSIPE
jgi:hypothetical protein